MIEDVKNNLKDLIFPNICLCGKWGEVLCGDCRDLVVPYKTELCPVCKRISENGLVCPSCKHKSYLTGLMIYGKHRGVLKKLIWSFKYEFIRDLSIPLSDLLIDKYSDILIEKKFVITSVPSSKSRKNWRGYNQSELLATQLADKLGLEKIQILNKQDNVSAQVGLKRIDRIKNIEGKISLTTDKKFKGRILIIDDVVTTGATLEECAKMLRKAGFKEVWGLVLSRE